MLLFDPVVLTVPDGLGFFTCSSSANLVDELIRTARPGAYSLEADCFSNFWESHLLAAGKRDFRDWWYLTGCLLVTLTIDCRASVVGSESVPS